MLINCVSCKDDSHSQNGGKNKDSSCANDNFDSNAQLGLHPVSLFSNKSGLYEYDNNVELTNVFRSHP